MCIYLGNDNLLSYETREHVIPAAIGGLSTLEKGLVSDEFNNYFSKIEREVLQTSIISLPRQFFGPGKRGSLSPTNSSMGNWALFEENDTNELVLGFLAKGMPKLMPQLHFDIVNPSKNYTMHLSNLTEEKEFWKKMESPFIKDIRVIEELNSKIIIGLFRNSFIAAVPNEKDIPIVDKVVESLKKGKEKSRFQKESSHQVKMSAPLTVDLNNLSRFYGKIAINAATYLYGPGFITENDCSKMIAWITGDTDEDPGVSPPSNLFDPFSSKGTFPPMAHYVIITQMEDTIIANISLYGFFASMMVLSSKRSTPIPTNGLICDWKKRLEYTLLDYILEKGWSQNNLP